MKKLDDLSEIKKRILAPVKGRHGGARWPVALGAVGAIGAFLFVAIAIVGACHLAEYFWPGSVASASNYIHPTN